MIIQPLYNQNKTSTPLSGNRSTTVIKPIYNSGNIAPKVKPQVIIPKKPIKKDEQGGLFDLIKKHISSIQKRIDYVQLHLH